MKARLILLALLLASINAQAGGLYRWTDAAGQVHYGDAPPPGAAGVEQKSFDQAPAADDAGLPYETRLAHKNFPVTLYTAENCGEPCKQASEFLSHRGIPFTEKKLSTQEELDELKKRSGSDTVPVLAVGRDFLKGFLAASWDAALNDAGYPKAP